MSHTTQYRLKEDYLSLKKDALVRKALVHDYGIASDDTRMMGEECISVSKDGNYPVTSVPLRLLERA